MRTAAAELVLALSIWWVASAQEYARIRGHVLDENNAPVANAEVTVRYESRDVITFSDPTGAFTVPVPQSGDYAVRVTSPGFFELNERNLHFDTGVNELTLVLNRVRENSESLKVSAISPNIEMDKSASEQRLESPELLEIPFRDSTFQNSMRILPGVTQDNGGDIHVNGGAPDQAYYSLDGFNISDPLSGTFESRLGVEAVQSMTVSSGSVSAEYGKGTAGVVALNTTMGDDRFRYSAINFFPGFEYRKRPILGSWTPRFNLSGPLEKGKIWFSDSLTAQYAKDVVSGLPAGQDESSSWRYSNIFRAQINLSPSNILYAGFLVNQSAAVRDGLGALDPPPTTTDQRSHQLFFDVKDQLYFGHGSLLEYGYASNRTYGREIPQGNDFYIFTPFGNSGNYFVNSRLRGSRDQFLANYFLPSFTWAGGHQIKAGIDIDRRGYWQDINRTGFLDYGVGNVLVREVMFTGNGRVGESNYEASVYVEDSWRLRPQLLLELGLRADWDQILHNWNTGPRFGFAWAPFGLEHTKISGGYGLLYDQTNLSLFARASDQVPVSTFYGLPGEAPYTSIATFVIGARHLDSPRSQNFNLGVEQQFPNGLFTSIRAISRRGSHGLSYFETTGLANDAVYSLLDQRRDSYDAMEFTARHHVHKRYEWLASYTRSRAVSNAVLDLSADQPLIVTNNYGHVPWDAPNRFLSWAFLPTGFKNWSLMYLFEWHSGFPYSVHDEQGLVIGGVDAARFPDFVELNLAIERQLEYRGQRWALRLGVNNILGRLNPNVVNNDVNSPQFGQFFGGQRQTIALRIRWLGKA
jgi:hypothetical protein